MDRCIISRRRWLLLSLSLVAVSWPALAQAPATLPSFKDDKGDTYEFSFEPNPNNKGEWKPHVKITKKDAKPDEKPQETSTLNFLTGVMTTTVDEKTKDATTGIKNRNANSNTFQITCPKNPKESPSIRYNFGGTALDVKISDQTPEAAHKTQDAILAELKKLGLPSK